MGQAAIPIAMGLVSLAGGYMQNRSATNRAKSAQKDAQKFYDKTSLPEPAAVEAQGTENRGQLGQARLGSYQNLSKNLASRGFGSGSGLGIKAAGDIEGNYLRSLGESQTGLTKFANTRQFAPGQDAYGYSVPGGLEGAFGQGNNMLNTTMGMYMANKMLNGGEGATPYQAPWYLASG